MKPKLDTSLLDLWKGFIKNNPKFEHQKMPETWYFCDNEKDANECAQLVVDGIKQATCISLWWYKTNQHPLPKIGDLNIITNWEGQAKAIIQTTKIENVPFNKITQEFAEIEGEGDKSLGYWKRVHSAYYTREMAPYNEKFDENMMLICEHFKTIFTKK